MSQQEGRRQARGVLDMHCAVIAKQVDEKTRSETSISELLRGLAD